jgi:hypothetical protein
MMEFVVGTPKQYDVKICHWGWQANVTFILNACGEKNLSLHLVKIEIYMHITWVYQCIVWV